jgi:hypothetical protein
MDRCAFIGVMPTDASKVAADAGALFQDDRRSKHGYIAGDGFAAIDVQLSESNRDIAGHAPVHNNIAEDTSDIANGLVLSNDDLVSNSCAIFRATGVCHDSGDG